MGEGCNRSPMAIQNHQYHSELPSPTPHQQPITPSEPPLRCSPPPQHQASAIKECIAGHQRELEALLAENQRLAASHAALKQEYTSIKQDLRHLAAISQKIKAEKDAEFREVLERSVKAEAEFRAMETFNADLAVVREEVEKRKLEKEELGARLKAVNGDIAKAKLEARDLPGIRAEKERIALDNKKGRAAVEVERKNRAINLEQGEKMEKIKLSMIQEIDKLNAELANAKKRATTAAAATAANINQGLDVRTKYSNPSRVHRIGSSPIHQRVEDQNGSNRSSSNCHDPVQPVGGRGKQEPEMSVTDSKSHQNNENVLQQQAGHENPQPAPTLLDAASMKFLRDMMAETFQAYVQKHPGQTLTGGPTPPPQLAGKIALTKEDENKVFREWMSYELKSIRARHEKMDELATLEESESKKPNNAKRKACQCNQQGFRAKSDPRAPAQSGEAQASSYNCYNCGDPSHLRKDCDKPDRICRKCGKNGHIAVFCRTKLKKKKNAPKLGSTQSESSNVLFESRAKVG